MPRERIKTSGPAPKKPLKYRIVNGKRVQDHSGLGLKKVASGAKTAVKAVGKTVKKAAKSKRVRQAAVDAVLGTRALRAGASLVKKASKKPAQNRNKKLKERASKKK